VRRSTTIPVASGEREFTRFDFQDLLERRALDIAQPDVARAGGMTEIRRIPALTSAHGVRLAPHACGSGVLFAVSIHVALVAPNCHILEVTQGYIPMMWDLFNEPFDIRPDGIVHAPGRAKVDNAGAPALRDCRRRALAALDLYEPLPKTHKTSQSYGLLDRPRTGRVSPGADLAMHGASSS
jgi:hypothetical protein